MTGAKPVMLMLLFFIAVTTVSAQEPGDYFGYTTHRDGSGGVVLKITSNSAGDDSWLGITIYPPNSKKPQQDAVRTLIPLKNGRQIKQYRIEPRYNNGTFEAALWSQKLTGSECPFEDAACLQYGYKLEGMTGYLWGYLTVH